MAFHHAQVGAAQDEQQVGVAQVVVPGVLEDAGQGGVVGQEVGEFIQQQGEAFGLRQDGQLVEGLGPGGVGEGGRWECGGVGEGVEGLGEGTQLVVGGGEVSDPVEGAGGALLPPVGEEAGFADAAAAVDDEEGGAGALPEGIKKVEFSAAADEGFHEDYYTDSL